jgi:hypothetical protein
MTVIARETDDDRNLLFLLTGDQETRIIMLGKLGTCNCRVSKYVILISDIVLDLGKL